MQLKVQYVSLFTFNLHTKLIFITSTLLCTMQDIFHFLLSKKCTWRYNKKEKSFSSLNWVHFLCTPCFLKILLSLFGSHLLILITNQAKTQGPFLKWTPPKALQMCFSWQIVCELTISTQEPGPDEELAWKNLMCCFFPPFLSFSA